MKVLIINYPDHVMCQVKTQKYLLEAKVTEHLTIFSVNLRIRKLPKSKSANLLKKAAREVGQTVKSHDGEYNRDLSFDCLLIERRINGEGG